MSEFSATSQDRINRADPRSSAAAPPVPDYELLRCIGRGSYGDVWLARNVLGQCRAVKIIYRNRFADPRPFEREFEGIQRFEPISRSHPSQLAILHVGKNDAAGCFYYVMELADDAVGTRSTPSEEPVGTGSTPSDSSNKIGDGVKSVPTDPLNYLPHTLRSDLERHSRLPIPDCVQIGLSLATALAHLHEQGLVHRDIKPSNIIFVNGVAKLGDIGLVTEAGDTQSIVGTEGYLPPEGPGTPQADLFSLGKVLYEMSTGMDRRRFAELPDDLREWPDRSAVFEFNPIVLRACAKDPAQRYQTSEQLRGDLALLQEGKSIKRVRFSQHWKTLMWKVALLSVLIAAVALLARGIWPERVNPSDRLSANPLALKEYHEGLRTASRDTGEGSRQGIEHFKRAIELDPKFAMAYNGLYEIYVANPARPEVMECVSRMLELEPKLAEAHAALGYLSFLNWKWDEAKPHFRRAIEFNPNCAIAQYRKAMELEPSYLISLTYIGYAQRAMGNYLEAIDSMRTRDVALATDKTAMERRHAELRQAFDAGGKAGYWKKLAEQSTGLPDNFVYCYWPAQAAANLSDFPRAFDLLDEYFSTNRLESLEWLLYDEVWDPVHDDPRFIALLKKTGLRK